MLTIREKPTDAELVKAIQWTGNNIDEIYAFFKKTTAIKSYMLDYSRDVYDNPNFEDGTDKILELYFKRRLLPKQVPVRVYDYILYISGTDGTCQDVLALSQEQFLAQYDIINATWRQQNFYDARDIEAACVSCV